MTLSFFYNSKLLLLKQIVNRCQCVKMSSGYVDLIKSNKYSILFSPNTEGNILLYSLLRNSIRRQYLKERFASHPRRYIIMASRGSRPGINCPLVCWAREWCAAGVAALQAEGLQASTPQACWAATGRSPAKM